MDKNAFQFIWKETRRIWGNICSAWSKVDPGMKFVIVILAALLVVFILKDFGSIPGRKTPSGNISGRIIR